MKLEWTEPAISALQAIHDFIALDQPFYAARFIDRLTLAAERLIDFPKLGRRVPEARRGEARELVFQGYRIMYRVRSDRVQVLNVLHGSRDLSRMKPKPWNT